jgi:hypothetical protein
VIVNCGNGVHPLWKESTARPTGRIAAFAPGNSAAWPACAAGGCAPAARLGLRAAVRLVAGAGLGGRFDVTEIGDVKFGPAADEPVRVVEVIGGR